MPEPKAICIEEIQPDAGKSRFISCVALPGGQPGLGLDGECRILWKGGEAVSCEIWVSADEQLILYRPEGARESRLKRAGRSLDVPFSKPVVLVNKDEIVLAGKRVRIYIHGGTNVIHAPEEFVPQPSVVERVKRSAAAVVLGSVVAVAGCVEVPEPKPSGTTGAGTQTSKSEPIEVRDMPPLLAPKDVPEKTEPKDVEKTEGEKEKKIEVREFPPRPAGP
ncbi:MAG: hypothetical protein ACYS8W_11365 [Planctomycetota bacterium]|jgi:hypothetical protein